MFVCSQHSYGSKWVEYELNYAYALKKTIYIVNADEIAQGRVDYVPCADTWFLDENYKSIKLFEDRNKVVS